MATSCAAMRVLIGSDAPAHDPDAPRSPRARRRGSLAPRPRRRRAATRWAACYARSTPSSRESCRSTGSGFTPGRDGDRCTSTAAIVRATRRRRGRRRDGSVPAPVRRDERPVEGHGYESPPGRHRERTIRVSALDARARAAQHRIREQRVRFIGRSASHAAGQPMPRLRALRARRQAPQDGPPRRADRRLRARSRRTTRSSSRSKRPRRRALDAPVRPAAASTTEPRRRSCVSLTDPRSTAGESAGARLGRPPPVAARSRSASSPSVGVDARPCRRRANSPSSTPSASGSTSRFWITRFSGRAP